MNLLVFTDTTTAELELLNKLPAEVKIIFASTLEDVRLHALTADVLFICKVTKNRECLKLVLEVNPHLKWVQTWWTGVDSLIFPELKNYPVVVTNAKGAYAPPLAEFTIFACLYFAKEYLKLNANKNQKKWEQFEGGSLFGKTMGIFGLGEIGSEIARRAQVMNMKVIACKRRFDSTTKNQENYTMVRFEDSEELFSKSDFVVNAAPITKHTAGYINYNRLCLMKESSVFINVGRGPVVVEKDLIKILEEKKIKGAALDVFEKEPLDRSSPLWDFDNVIISPHSADRYEGWLIPPFELFIQNCKRFLKGEELLNIVDIEEGY